MPRAGLRGIAEMEAGLSVLRGMRSARYKRGADGPALLLGSVVRWALFRSADTLRLFGVVAAKNERGRPAGRPRSAVLSSGPALSVAPSLERELVWSQSQHGQWDH
jgi:hypothetical protein